MKTILFSALCYMLAICSGIGQEKVLLEIPQAGSNYAFGEGSLKELRGSSSVDLYVKKPDVATFDENKLGITAGKSKNLKINSIDEKNNTLNYRFNVRDVVDPSDKQLTIKILYDGQNKGEVTLGIVNTEGGKGEDRGTATTNYNNLTAALNAAYKDAQKSIGATLYSEKGNMAAFVVDQFGTTYASPEKQIDDNDKVYVYTVKPQSMRLKVALTSPLRDPIARYVLGQEELDEQEDEIFVYNYERPTEIKDFKYGEVTISIDQVISENELKDVGSFKFAANRLYYGAYHFGPIYTFLKDEEYGLTETDDGNQIYVKDERSPRIHYVFGFSPFIFGKKDIEKTNFSVDPFIGIPLKDIGDNALLGISAGRPGFVYLLGGVHIGKVTRLEESSELRIGSIFDKQETEIPTTKKWKSDWFIGASFDLQAVLRLVGSFVNPT